MGARLRWGLAHHLCLVLLQREVSDHWFGAAVHFLHLRQFGLDCCSFREIRACKRYAFFFSFSQNGTTLSKEIEKQKHQGNAERWHYIKGHICVKDEFICSIWDNSRILLAPKSMRWPLEMLGKNILYHSSCSPLPPPPLQLRHSVRVS